MILAVLSLFDDLANLSPTWISQNDYVIDAIADCGILTFPRPNNYLPSLQKWLDGKERFDDGFGRSIKLSVVQEVLILENLP